VEKRKGKGRDELRSMSRAENFKERGWENQSESLVRQNDEKRLARTEKGPGLSGHELMITEGRRGRSARLERKVAQRENEGSHPRKHDTCRWNAKEGRRCRRIDEVGSIQDPSFSG